MLSNEIFLFLVLFLWEGKNFFRSEKDSEEFRNGMISYTPSRCEIPKIQFPCSNCCLSIQLKYYYENIRNHIMKDFFTPFFKSR